jgi:hypothetical protein
MTEERQAVADILHLLTHGTMDMEGLVPWGSNYTFLVHIGDEKAQVDAIYKPRKGERPLWDFGRGTLCQRERAAYVVSESLGWNIVPVTVLRDGPYGYGSVQHYVEHDPEQHYLTFEGQFPDSVKRIALFDVLINNADRKSGHVLKAPGGRLWAIDHGVCFHTDPKLRSVIWEYAGQPIPPPILGDLVSFHIRLCDCNDDLCQQLAPLLSRPEIEAMKQRLQRLIDNGIFPQPGAGRHYPWPLV